MNNKNKEYINRAFYLAYKGIRKAFPNPMVGCVIVKNNIIIGEGYHKKYGENHAEINAINSVVDKKNIKNSSIYINLEPCCHHGKTPPCVEEIIKYKPKEVIISNIDPNKKVQGKGIKKLISNGIRVIDKVEEQRGLLLNKRFFTNQIYKKPYIILKWAETADGFIAKENGDSKWISHETSRTIVHKWRSEESGILVGVNTIDKDNPKLTVRKWKGESPIRIVIDPNNRIKKSSVVLKDKLTTLLYNRKINESKNNKYFIKKDDFKLENILKDILRRGVGSILVEGGTKTINHFIKSNSWNEIRIFVSKKKFIKGIQAPKRKKDKMIVENIENDLLYTEFNIDA
jgi:diaminohydroxyphosphoribosylaminopyrimidine deaminase / 5-amino-6-(5-phosphoribosylamino)uracil reductase